MHDCCAFRQRKQKLFDSEKQKHLIHLKNEFFFLETLQLLMKVWEFKCQLVCLLNLYIDLSTRYILAQYIIGIKTADCPALHFFYLFHFSSALIFCLVFVWRFFFFSFFLTKLICLSFYFCIVYGKLNMFCTNSMIFCHIV